MSFYLTEYFPWAGLAPPSRDLMIILWPSDPLEGPPEDFLSLGRGEVYAHVDTPRAVCPGSLFMKLGLCFISGLLFCFPGKICLSLILAIYVLSHFIKCQPTLVGLMKMGESKEIWTHSPSLLITPKARLPWVVMAQVRTGTSAVLALARVAEPCSALQFVLRISEWLFKSFKQATPVQLLGCGGTHTPESSWLSMSVSREPILVHSR